MHIFQIEVSNKGLNAVMHWAFIAGLFRLSKWSSKMNKPLLRGLVAAGSVALVGGAQAAAVDVTALVTDIGTQAAPIGLVGGAVLLIYMAVKAFKFIRAAMS
jgi:hypothetical protein